MPRCSPASLIVLLVLPLGTQAATPLCAPQIKDMILVGQEGASRSATTRSLTLAGDYLYASGTPGMATIRVSNPANLVLTDDYTDTSLQPNQSAVKSGVLYLANWTPEVGLLMLDLANPAHPTHLRTIPTAFHAWSSEIFGNTLYLTIGMETNSGVNTYDITNPSNPVLVNAFTIGDRLLSNVARFGNYIYFTHKSELQVYSVANPSSPQFLRVAANIDSSLGNVRIYNNVLWVLGRDVISQQGGLWSFSLADPANPQQLGHWEQNEPRDMCFLNSFCVVPCSGSGIYTLNIGNPANITEACVWFVSWPNTGSHGGFPVCVAGAGTYVYVGTTSGSDPNCPDFTCPYYGGRVYSAKVLLEPPLIAPVTPDPEPHLANTPYTRQLTLTEGTLPVTWSLVQAPPGATIDGNGRVSGWTPALDDVGFDFSFEAQAANSDGQGTRGWSVRVTFQANGDFDGDVDVDQSDFGHLQACLAGDSVHYARGCGDADFDGDMTVGPADVNAFMNYLQGAEVPGGC
jgi:hypothetical protein